MATKTFHRAFKKTKFIVFHFCVFLLSGNTKHDSLRNCVLQITNVIQASPVIYLLFVSRNIYCLFLQGLKKNFLSYHQDLELAAEIPPISIYYQCSNNLSIIHECNRKKSPSHCHLGVGFEPSTFRSRVIYVLTSRPHSLCNMVLWINRYTKSFLYNILTIQKGLTYSKR